MSIRVGMRPMARPSMGLPLRLYCEDFTLFTEVDPAGDVTVTADKVDINTMRRDAAAHTWRWYGVGYFDDFEHRIDVEITTAVIGGWVVVWMVSNDVGTATRVWLGELGAISVRCLRIAGGDYVLEFAEYHAGPIVTYDRYTVSAGTTYYLTITRSGSTCTCKVYSDSKRTALLDTMTVNLTGVSDGTFSFIQTASMLLAPLTPTPTMTCFAENLCREETPWPEENIPCISLSEDFDDNSVNPYCWAPLETGTAWSLVKNQRLECSGGVVADYAGLASVAKHELSGHSIEVDVLNDSRGTQELLIALTKTVNSDPFKEDDVYRIMKYNATNNYYVQRRIGGGAVSTLASGAWSGAAGSLKIVISGGTIYFYEEATLRHSEAYALASTEVFIYIDSFGSLGLLGMDYFDNFVFT